MLESPMKKKPLPFENSSDRFLYIRQETISNFQFLVPKGYETLAKIALKACKRVWESKGIERHANNLPFDMQPIMTITRQHGHGFTRGQALKKIDEATALGKEAALVEILEAITYLMADALILEEEIRDGK